MRVKRGAALGVNQMVRLKIGEHRFLGFVIVRAGVEQQANHIMALCRATAHPERPAMPQAAPGIAAIVVLRSFEIPGEQTIRARSAAQLRLESFGGGILHRPCLGDGSILQIFRPSGERDAIERHRDRPLAVNHVRVAVAPEPPSLPQVYQAFQDNFDFVRLA